MQKAYQWFDDQEGIYNYCPAPVIVDDKTMYVFYCGNAISEMIIDDIYMRKGTLIDDKWEFSERQRVLQPSRTDWDCIHVCDPDVIKGEFHYKGEKYEWIMVYLGCDIHYNNHNQVGIAFAKSIEGPYIKYDKNPIVQYSDLYHWGAGQPCIISLDEKGKFRMLYSQTTHQYENKRIGMKTFWCDFDFYNADQPVIGEPLIMNEEGLTNKNNHNNEQLSVFNPSMLWDRESDYYYLTREGTPFERDQMPNFIASYTQLFRIKREDFQKNNGLWEVLYHIDVKDTGFHRNHNAGLIKNSYGYRITEQIEVAVTVSEVNDGGFLWTYRIYHIHTGITP